MGFVRFLKVFGAVALAVVCSAANFAMSQTGESEPMIPQNLLKLIHSPEVQSELGVADDERLVTILRDLDAVWWPARILPEDKQVATVRDLEVKLIDALKPMLSETKLKRLRQIEVQSQSTRALLRPENAKLVGLDEKQLRAMKDACVATDAVARKLQAIPGGDPELQKQLQAAQEEELRVINGLLTAANRQAIGKLVGEPFDTKSLKRIYPLAPELKDSGEWVGVERTTLKAEQGKVVLVHFYAFQCHNCVANFGHYNRWQSALTQKGVRVIGIQTPETRAERDPGLVREAAAEQGFAFPVLIDLENTNWTAWGNNMWPTVYVIDKKGYIRFWWQGELNWQGATGDKAIEKLIDDLLAEE